MALVEVLGLFVSVAPTSAGKPTSNVSVTIFSNVLFIFFFLDEFVFVFPPAQLHPISDCACGNVYDVSMPSRFKSLSGAFWETVPGGF
jgi:hypothetical protein